MGQNGWSGWWKGPHGYAHQRPEGAGGKTGHRQLRPAPPERPAPDRRGPFHHPTSRSCPIIAPHL